MISQRIDLLRKYLKKNGIYAIIVPSNDPHFGEYIQDYYKCREWISGFDGSAGTVVITLDEAVLWTDSRYFIQAENQLKGSEFILKKIKVPGNETIEEWLLSRYANDYKIGIDSALFSFNDYNSLKESLSPYKVELIDDPFVEIWDDRPKKISKKISIYDIKYAGEDTTSKHKRLISLINTEGEFAYIVTSCEESAWLCNIRGADVDYNPLPMVFSIVEKDKISLFCNLDSVTDSDKSTLESMNIYLFEYDLFKQALADIPAHYLRIASGDKISAGNYFELTKDGSKFSFDKSRGGYITNLKAVKNGIECDGFRRSHILDGVAWVKYLKFIEDSTSSGKIIKETELAHKLIEFRKESEYYIDESFEPIVAFGANGAMPHYSPSERFSVIIKDGILLTDMGAHYIFGTTDTTRTLCIGEPTDEQRNDYTAVLRGMINLSMAQFPKGTRGSSLDFLARGEICSNEKIYMHGTGHGVGHYLPVHEGPQSIRMEENPVVLVPGMVQSNEPAVYVQGKYGIRIENLILCKEHIVNEYGTFYNFETLTFVPIDTQLIDKSLLEEKHKRWLNDYHKNVYLHLSPYLNFEEQEWLMAKTAAID